MFKEIWQKFKKWIVGLVLILLGGGGTYYLANVTPMPNTTFENLPNVAKEQGLYRITFDEYSDVEIKDQNTPEVKLRKWGDETYIKLSYPDFSPVSPKQSEGKMKWVNGDKEVHLYQSENSFKFEPILKIKPVTNKIILHIETKGLRFFYQPDLTQQEKDEGAFRPDNVIGSYAVYHDTQQPLHAGQEEAEKYKVGKAFHIYRPKLIDSNNWEVWGDLFIDTEKGKYEITIPTDFWNNAVYPIRSNDTFGNTTCGASAFTGSNTITSSTSCRRSI